MRVIEITNEFSLGNGRSQVIKEISSYLSRYFTVEIWYSYSIGTLPKVEGKTSSVKKLSTKDMFKNLIKIKEPTIVHTHFGKTFLITSLARLLNKNIKHIHTEYVNPPLRKIYPNQTKRLLIGLIKWLLVYFLDFIAYRKVDIAIGISNYATNEIRKYFISDKKIKRIYLGINTRKYLINIKKVRAFRRKLGIRKKDFLFGCLSRFSRSKNTLYLIKQFKNFPKKSKLIIGGAIDVNDKKYLKECEETAKQNDVKLIINLEEKELISFYNAIDVFIYPSLWEGFGLPILEAMACGKPVICFNRFAMPELVKNHYNGFCVKNDREFLEAVYKIASDTNLIKKLGKNAKKTAINLNIEKQGKKYKEIIEKISKNEKFSNL